MREEFETLIINSQELGGNSPSLGYIQKLIDICAERKQKLLGGKLRITFPEYIKIDAPAKIWQDKMIEWARYDSASLIDRDTAMDVYDFLNLNRGSNFCSIESWRSHPNLKGMKVTKALKYVIDDPRSLDLVQQKASTFIQNGKTEGYLTFSVHPLDYLTISEPFHSCHSLNGDYRAGNISYMTDNSTIVCYLSSKEPTMTNYGTPWYAKTWRVLLHINEDGDFAVINRQYPFECPDLLAIVEEKAKELFKGLREDWCDDLIDKTKYFKTHESALLYNDLRKSPYYPHPIHTRMPLDKKPKPIVLGGPTPCLMCGDDIYREDSFFCDECIRNYELFNHDEYCLCSSCGDISSREDTSLVIDENGDAQDYCYNCTNNYTWICDCCNTMFSDEVTIYHDKDGINDYCRECWEDLCEDQ